MTTTLAKPTSDITPQTVEAVLLGGDLSRLTPQQRVAYYTRTCESLGLNPLTRPFEYITLNGKLTLYARKDATDQLRKIHGISIAKPDITFEDDWIVVSVLASTKDGRTDADTGVVNKRDMRGEFGNAIMKAITKAKRRATLSICGLGMLDETEVTTVPDARPMQVDTATGEIIDAPTTPAALVPKPSAGGACISNAQRRRLFAIAKDAGWSVDQVKAYLASAYDVLHSQDIKAADYDDIVTHLQEGVDGAGAVR